MTGREWKPGDVARMTTPSGNVVTYIKTRWDGDWWGVDQHGDTYTNRKVDDSVRPLVVIDPEDREQVERLAQAYLDKFGSGHPSAAIADQMQAALREFANPTPPKPDEPTGLGAVVEDADGKRWVRRAAVHYPWVLGLSTHAAWGEITAVRVLSEGVTS